MITFIRGELEQRGRRDGVNSHALHGGGKGLQHQDEGMGGYRAAWGRGAAALSASVQGLHTSHVTPVV